VFGSPNSNELLELIDRHADATGWKGALARTAASPIGGVVAGALFIASVARLTTVASEFLYFQF
jgi:hypothetical protein